MREVKADYARCQGHGRCSLIAPDVFDVSDEGKVLLITSELSGDLFADVDEAVTSCPEGALAWA